VVAWGRTGLAAAARNLVAAAQNPVAAGRRKPEEAPAAVQAAGVWRWLQAGSRG
jgi:hypothetical protein